MQVDALCLSAAQSACMLKSRSALFPTQVAAGSPRDEQPLLQAMLAVRGRVHPAPRCFLQRRRCSCGCRGSGVARASAPAWRTSCQWRPQYASLCVCLTSKSCTTGSAGRQVHSKRPSPHNSPLHWQSTPTQVLIATYLTQVHAQRARASPKHGCTWTAAHAESRLTCGPRAVTQRWHHPGTAPARAPARPPARRPRPAAGPLRAARRPGARPPLVESPPWGRAPRRHHTHSRASPRPLRQPRRRRAPQRQPRRARAPLRPQARRPQRQGGSHSRQRPLRRTPGPPRPPTQPRGRPARRRRRRRPAARGGAPPRPPRRARSGSGSGQPWTRRRAAGAGPARPRTRPPAGPSPPARRRGAGSRTGGLLAARR